MSSNSTLPYERESNQLSSIVEEVCKSDLEYQPITVVIICSDYRTINYTLSEIKKHLDSRLKMAEAAKIFRDGVTFHHGSQILLSTYDNPGFFLGRTFQKVYIIGPLAELLYHIHNACGFENMRPIA